MITNSKSAFVLVIIIFFYASQCILHVTIFLIICVALVCKGVNEVNGVVCHLTMCNDNKALAKNAHRTAKTYFNIAFLHALCSIAMDQGAYGVL